MKYIVLFIALLLLSVGCVPLSQSGGGVKNVEPVVIFKPSPTSYLLNCINDLQGMNQRSFNRNYKEVSGRVAGGTDQDTLQMICLSVSSRAGYKQFKQGKKLLRQYLAEHPDASTDLNGLQALIDRLDQARINRWAAYRRLLEEKEGLSAEVEELRLEVRQDKGKIDELKNQIDQLKNIENIIKNRERLK